MNLKLRSDSVIGAMPPERRKLVEQWLFKENISYREAAERYLKDFGVKISPGTFNKYFRRLHPGNLIGNIAVSAEMAGALAAKFKDEKFCEAFGLLTGQMAFEAALECSPPASEETRETPDQNTPPTEAPASPSVPSGEAPCPQVDSPKTANKERPQRDRQKAKFDALALAGSLFTTALKLKFAKEGVALEHKKFELELQKHQDHVAQQKGKIEDALQTGKRKKGGISEATMRKIEEACNLL